ncbi:hypothetical protein GCM10025864_01270 [Luteimicrobium album]|uniref:Uncharacterized protein n=1 Tax=Luteimicrobium album TaxID=1054550 RepID=A0ABQ6HWW5_9MICO|nr:hypothetical protein GCM10025864_01270 [Luteimicrobium album]
MALLQDRRREPDGGHGVAGRRLGDHDVVGEHGKLLLGGGHVRAAGHEDDVARSRERLEAVDGRLQERPAGAREIVQELRRARS